MVEGTIAVIYWHATERDLSIGDVIAPGRWGTWLGACGSAHKQWDRETALEQARLTHRPDAVSRLACAYAFIERPVVDEYMAQGDGSDRLYQVRPVEPEKPVTHHDMLYVTWLGEVQHNESTREGWRRDYWLGHSTRNPAWEYLFRCGLEVVARATT